MIKVIFYFAIIMIVLEIAFGFIFHVLYLNFVDKHTDENRAKFDTTILNLLKGMIERVTITVAFINGMPQILIFFGAMKIGTRINDMMQDKGANDYILIGNMLSVLISYVYLHIYKNMGWILQLPGG